VSLLGRALLLRLHAQERALGGAGAVAPLVLEKGSEIERPRLHGRKTRLARLGRRPRQIGFQSASDIANAKLARFFESS
jgi:hypothetical protein